MGLFDRRKEEISELENLLKMLKNNNYVLFYKYADEILKGKRANIFGNEENLISIIFHLFPQYQQFENYNMTFDQLEKDYSFLLSTSNTSECITEIKKMYMVNGLVENNLFSIELYSIFDNKQYFWRIMNMICEYETLKNRFDVIKDYLLQLKKYYANENEYTSSVIGFLSKAISKTNLSKLIILEIDEARKQSGIYNINSDTLAEIDVKLNGAENVFVRLENQIKQIDVIMKSAEKIKEKNKEELNSLTQELVNKMQTLAENLFLELKNLSGQLDLNLKKQYREFIEQEKSGIVLVKDDAVRNLILEADKKLKEIELVINSVSSSTTFQIQRISAEADASLKKLDDFTKMNPNIPEVVKELRKSEGLIKEFVATGSPTVTEAVAAIMTPNITQKSPGMIIKNEDSPINRYFDDSIPFVSRFNELMEKKQKLIEENDEIFHEKFDDLLTLIIENDAPYLIGPSGTGKTYLVGQAARLLNIDSYDFRDVAEKYELLGYKTATGEYCETNFYDAFLTGKIAFFDEIDSRNSQARLILNSFITENKNPTFPFPNGIIKQHPNFRIVAAGNTMGQGADDLFDDREKMDESIQQRLTPIIIGYDDRIDKKMLKDYPDWRDFIIAFRKATSAWENKNQRTAAGVITTRDVARIVSYLKNESLSVEKILQYRFIQIKDSDYLIQLRTSMEREIAQTDKFKGDKILKKFIDLTNSTRR